MQVKDGLNRFGKPKKIKIKEVNENELE